MLDQKDRSSFVPDREQEFAERRTFSRVKPGGRFVEAEQRGFGAHGARDFYTPLIAIRQIAGRIVGSLQKTDAVEPSRGLIDGALLGRAPGGRAKQAEKGQPRRQNQSIVMRHHQVLERGHAGKQPDILKRARYFRLLGDYEIVQPLELDITAVIMGEADRARGRSV